MTEQLSHEELQELAKELKINTPIMSHRVVGDRIELFLLGGHQVVSQPKQAVDIPSLLADLSVTQLRQIAKDLGVTGYSKMKKEALLHALSELPAHSVADALTHF